MANTAVSTPSTARNTPVGSFISRGSATLRFFMKYALPSSTVSPRMVASTPPSSQNRSPSTGRWKPPSAVSCRSSSGVRLLPAALATDAASDTARLRSSPNTL